MKIHIIGTINGTFDEGMRNVATHIARAFENGHTVCYSRLKSIFSIVKNSCSCDVSVIFARANKQVYWLTRVVEFFAKNIWLVCVQEPNSDFIRLTAKNPLKANYLAVVESDLGRISLAPNYQKQFFQIGIQPQKFTPVNSEQKKKLKEKYGMAQDRPLVIHVGHCSAGRGLEDFALITNAEKLVVASGMFEDAETVKALGRNGVRIFRGYMENIEEVYQMADVYLFPTRSTEFVISIPLSVMEALSCGVPVIGYKEFVNLAEIPAKNGAITLVESREDLNDAVVKLAQQNSAESFLKDPNTWEQVAEGIINIIRGN